ncbi:MAG: NAD(P)H-binding protein, partial [Desulfobacterales bacterium]|nr:NAD(P)H-binding protein [Desulfobacterales bacterium]
MKVLVTGASGFTGSYVVPALLQSDQAVRCFMRSTSDISYLPDSGFGMAFGDLDDRESFRRALERVDALVNIASIGFGHAPGIVKAVSESGVKRAIFVSTTAIYTKLDADSKK